LTEDNCDLVRRFWQAMDKQDWESLRAFFGEEAIIVWPNTGEKFTPSRYVEINENYPGTWNIDLEHLETGDEFVVSVVNIHSPSEPATLRGIAFFKIEAGLIIRLTEYFADNHDRPLWRKYN